MFDPKYRHNLRHTSHQKSLALPLFSVSNPTSPTHPIPISRQAWPCRAFGAWSHTAQPATPGGPGNIWESNNGNRWEQNTDPFLPQNTQGVMMVLAARSLSDMASRWVRWWIYNSDLWVLFSCKSLQKHLDAGTWNCYGEIEKRWYSMHHQLKWVTGSTKVASSRRLWCLYWGITSCDTPGCTIWNHCRTVLSLSKRNHQIISQLITMSLLMAVVRAWMTWQMGMCSQLKESDILKIARPSDC